MKSLSPVSTIDKSASVVFSNPFRLVILPLIVALLYALLTLGLEMILKDIAQYIIILLGIGIETLVYGFSILSIQAAEKKTTTVELLKEAGEKFWSILVAYIITTVYIIIYPVIILAIAVLFETLTGSASGGWNIASDIVLTVSILASIYLVIDRSIRSLFTKIIVITEEKKAVNALLESKNAVKGNWWRTALTFAAATIPSMILLAVIVMPITRVDNLIFIAALAALVLIASPAITSYITAVMYYLYKGK